MLHKNQLVIMASLVATATLALTARADVITFDDIPAGRIGDQYLSRGVRFFVGNGEFGTSTGLLMQNGAPLTASAGPNWTAVSWPNIMNPGAEAGVPGNSDIIIHFFDVNGARTLANSVGIVNDMDGNPSTIFIEGFDLNGISLGRTQINGLGSGGSFSNPAIYSASIYAASGQVGLIGVDNFSFTLVPAPGTATLLGIVCCSMGRRSRRTLA